VEFYRDFVAKGMPAYLEGYAKHWPAYSKWSNKTYLREMSGGEVVYVERTTRDSNEFAYFQQKHGKTFMRYDEFLDKI